MSLTGGQSLSATVAWTGRGNSVVQVYVFDPVGNIVAQGNGSGKLRSLSYQALNAGLYTIQVDLQAGKSASYTLLTTY